MRGSQLAELPSWAPPRWLKGGSVCHPQLCPGGWFSTSRQKRTWCKIEVTETVPGFFFFFHLFVVVPFFFLPEEIPDQQCNDDQQQEHDQHSGKDVVVGGCNIFWGIKSRGRERSGRNVNKEAGRTGKASNIHTCKCLAAIQCAMHKLIK